MDGMCLELLELGNSTYQKQKHTDEGSDAECCRNMLMCGGHSVLLRQVRQSKTDMLPIWEFENTHAKIYFVLQSKLDVHFCPLKMFVYLKALTFKDDLDRLL